MSEAWKQLVALAGVAITAVGVVVGVVLHSADGLRADLDAMRAEATADRRAHQAAMDTFRTEMRRLAERQARVEGTLSVLVAEE